MKFESSYFDKFQEWEEKLTKFGDKVKVRDLSLNQAIKIVGTTYKDIPKDILDDPLWMWLAYGEEEVNEYLKNYQLEDLDKFLADIFVGKFD